MKSFIGLLAFIGAVVAFVAFVIWLFEIVWNFVMPDVFGVASLSFWQAAAIVFLVGYVGYFGGLGRSSRD